MSNGKGAVPREQWGSRLGFILAAAGSAVGLGNIWRFPYITGENGGGAFVLVYLLCVLAVGIPVMLCEISLGRHTRRNPVGAFKALKPAASTLAHLFGLGLVVTGVFLLAFAQWGWAVFCLLLGGLVFRYSWTVVGVMGVLAGFLILSFYSVVGGWSLGYIGSSVLGVAGAVEVEAAGEHFATFINNPSLAIALHFLFMLICVGIVHKGVKSGIEKSVRVLMPILFFLILVLILRGITLDGAMEGVRFYLTPDFSQLSAEGILMALGMAFFSLSLGMGAMITYGSYVEKEQNLFVSTLSIVGLDVLIALMAGLAIFPAVFAMGITPEEGPGLVFIVLPAVFSQIPLGGLWATVFFVLLSVAAVTSGISLLEVVTAFFVDEHGWSRRKAAGVCGSVIFLLGSLCAVSVGDWDRITWLQSFFQGVFGEVQGSFFDLLDNLTNNWLLPLGGMFIAIFVGWIWGVKKAVDEIRHGSYNFADVHLISLLAGLRDDDSHNSSVHVVTLASVWGIFIRFVSPVAVLIAFLHTIGWIGFEPVEPPAEADKPAVTEEQSVDE